MSATSPSREVARAIDEACDRFEAAWNASPPQPPPLLENFLPDDPGLRRHCLLELLGLERDYRILRGESPCADDYRERLPEYFDDVAEFFASPPDSPATWAGPVPNPPLHDGPVRVAGYELLDELGRGSMGIVYLARQVGLRRLVAVKVLHANESRPEVRARFKTEAETVARLDHPGVVQVHDSGLCGDGRAAQAYLVMEYCPGGNLGVKLAGEPQPPAVAADYVEQIARGVQAAHAANVVHRDLKPTNLLIDAKGRLKVGDFGLARVEQPGDWTRTGLFLGTPSYASPEQARGVREVGQAADVYSLGVILYECLTGRVPFKAPTCLETLELVRDQEPVPPCQLIPAVPRDLETICLKCLRKEPERRYASARALADDLLAFREGRAISARPVGLAEKAWRWVRGHRALAALYAVIVLTMAAGLAAGSYFTASLDTERERVNTALARADAASARAEATQAREQVQHYLALVGKAQTRIARPRAGWTWAALGELSEAARLPAAADAWPELRTDAAECFMGLDARPVRTLGERLAVYSVAWSPDGKWVALGQKAQNVLASIGPVTLVNPDDAQQTRTFTFPIKRAGNAKGTFDIATQVAFSPDGTRLAAATRSGWLHCWDVARPGKPVASIDLGKDTRAAGGLRFAPDGRSVYACAGRAVGRWVPGQPKFAATYAAPHDVDGLDVHPLDGWVALGGERVLRLNAVTLQPVGPPLDFGGSPVAFTPDGRCLLAARGDAAACWFLDGGMVSWQTTAPEGVEGGRIGSLSLGADGALMLTASSTRGDRHLCLWETASGRPVARLGITGGGRSAFAPDGQRFVVSDERGARLYEVNGLREQTWLCAGIAQPVHAFCLSADGGVLAHASGVRGAWACELTACSLPAGTPLARKSVTVESGDPPRLALSATGDRLSLAWEARAAKLAFWTLGKSSAVGPAIGEARQLRHDPDGRLWVTTTDQVRVYNDGEEVALWRHHSGIGQILTGKPGVWTVAPGKRWAAAGCRDGSFVALRLDGDMLTKAAALAASHGELNAVALSPDETTAVAGSSLGELIVVGVPDAKKRSSISAHASEVTAVAAAGNGLWASGGRGGRVSVWVMQGGNLRELFALRHARPVRDLAFHPDGVRLFVLLDGERGVRVCHLDKLRDALDRLGLGAGMDFGAAPTPVTKKKPDAPTPDVAPDDPAGLKVEWFASGFLSDRLAVRYERDVEAGKPPRACESSRRAGWLRAPKPGRYALTLRADGVARLWIDDVLVFDVRSTTHRADVDLGDKPHRLRVETSQQGGKQGVRLSWTPPGEKADTAVGAQWLTHAGPK